VAQREPRYHARVRRTLALGFLALGLSSSWLLARQAAPPASAEGARLDGLIRARIAEQTAAARAEAGPVRLGLKIDHGPTGSPASMQKEADSASAFLEQLKAIDTAKLTHDEWISYGIAEYQARMDAEMSGDFFWLPSLITPYSSPLKTLSAPFAAAPLKTQKDLDAYVAGLSELPATMKAYETRLQQQIEHGVVLPTEELRIAMPFLKSLAVAPPASAFSVKASRLSGFAPDAQARFQKTVDDKIAGLVNPAIEGLLQYIDGPYRAKTVRAVGLSQYPNGAAYYQHLIHTHTGLDLTPQQIHDIGLKEITRINGELEKLRVEAGFKGTFEEFKTYLRTDRRFYPTTSQQIGDTMMAAIHLIEPRMAQYFSTMPKAPYGVRRLAPELEPAMTYGIYSMPEGADPSGYYNYNGLNPETRSITMVTAIVFHELLPGHHYQLNLLKEHAAPGSLRSAMAPNSLCPGCGPIYTAYTEGWGEYSSDLAWEMGAYPDVWTKAGRLGMDLFTSQRLVVDTGMNALGWSREKAMQFMKDNTFEGDTQIDTETLRYSVDMPGQALAYKLGALAIKNARERVKTAQGASFDIRKFHDYFLEAGEMPLGMFEQHFLCLVSGEQHKR
jgi:uncharacterized protein (DUF885 family)